MQVVSFDRARARRSNARFLALQAAFERLGFTLDPLTEQSWLVQRFGMTRVLHSLDEAQGLLTAIGSEAP